jgi:hypothetical protein
MSTDSVQPPTRILKAASCPSLSSRSTLTYNIGVTSKSDLYIRILENSSSGYFSDEWIAFATIQALLGERKQVNAMSFQSCFKGKSVNTAGFLMAVLKDLQLIKPTDDNVRTYETLPSDAFVAEMTALMDASVDLASSAPTTSTPTPKKGTLKLKPSNTKGGTTGVAVRR